MTSNTCVKEYVCVNCGISVPNLYKQYSPQVLKLVKCHECNDVADKYIEYDEVIILIDLILLSKEAYRHVLFNVNFKNHWKLALLLLFMKSYYEWIRFKTNFIDSSLEQYSDGVFMEKSFYYCCTIAVLSEAAAFGFATGLLELSYVGGPWSKPARPARPRVHDIWKTYVLSSIGHFLLLSSMIWGDKVLRIHFILITVYVYISQVQALTVGCRPAVTRGALAAIMLTALLAQWVLRNSLRCTLWSQACPLHLHTLLDFS